MRAYLYGYILDALGAEENWELGDSAWDPGAGAENKQLRKYVNEAAEAFGILERIEDVRDKKQAYLVLDRIFERVREEPEVVYRLPRFKEYEEYEQSQRYQLMKEEHEDKLAERKAAKVVRTRKLKAPTEPVKRKNVQYKPYVPVKEKVGRAAIGFTPYAAPLAAAGEIAKAGGQVAGSLIGAAAEVMTTDLFVVKGRIARGTRKKPRTPIDWEIHGNVLGGAITLLAVGGFLWMSDLRIGPYLQKKHTGMWRWGPVQDGRVVWGNKVTYTDMAIPVSPGPRTFPEIYHMETELQTIHMGRGFSTRTVTRKVVDYAEVTVDPLFHLTEPDVEVKRFGIQARYHKTDTKAEEFVKNPYFAMVSPAAWFAAKYLGKP